MRTSSGALAFVAAAIGSAAVAQVPATPGTLGGPVGNGGLSSTPGYNPPRLSYGAGTSGPVQGDRAVTGRAANGLASPGATLPGTVQPGAVMPPVGTGTDAGVANGGRVGSTLNGGPAVDGTMSTSPAPPR